MKVKQNKLLELERTEENGVWGGVGVGGVIRLCQRDDEGVQWGEQLQFTSWPPEEAH